MTDGKRRIAVIGAGPAGLSFARALAGTDTEIILLERQPLSALSSPAFDGREIALTHRSVRSLCDLGVWPRIPPNEVHAMRQAKVLNGRSRFAMTIAPGATDQRPLGILVSNHLLRRALFEAVHQQSNVTLRTGVAVDQAQVERDRVRLKLSDGSILESDLLIAADSRFSQIRGQFGISTDIEPLGRTMLVGRVRHEADVEGAVTEWFDRGRTVALLPLDRGLSSIVLTLKSADADALSALTGPQLDRQLTQYCRGRWGVMSVEDRLHAYPLTLTYAHRFVADRFALVGDAAVGMHPVTAHGFNFGLAGAIRLAKLIADAPDVGDNQRLAHYATAHRAETRPLYQATRALVGLFTDDRPVAMAARHAALRIGASRPTRSALRALLMQPGEH
ncbi:5-demethoxyubiquinol-8 5-hydroxylase UbiM [Sphingopyxis fribergensis]